MGSTRLPNLSILGKYMYYRNLLNYNFNFWYYYYFFFFFSQIFFYLFYEKIINFKFKNYFKLNQSFKNNVISGEINFILNNKFILIKLNLLNFYSNSNSLLIEKNVVFSILKKKILPNFNNMKYKFILK